MFKLLHTYDLPTSIQIIVCVTVSTIPQYSSSILQFDIGLNSGYCAAWRPDTGDKRYKQQQERIWSPQLDAKDKSQDWSLFTYNTGWDTTTTQIPQGYYCITQIVMKWQIDIPQLYVFQGHWVPFTDIAPDYTEFIEDKPQLKAADTSCLDDTTTSTFRGRFGFE